MKRQEWLNSKAILKVLNRAYMSGELERVIIEAQAEKLTVEKAGIMNSGSCRYDAWIVPTSEVDKLSHVFKAFDLEDTWLSIIEHNYLPSQQGFMFPTLENEDPRIEHRLFGVTDIHDVLGKAGLNVYLIRHEPEQPTI